MRSATQLLQRWLCQENAADTPGVKRQWLIQKTMKYDFKSDESFDTSLKALQTALPDMKLEGRKHYRDYAVDGPGFSIMTQNSDNPGQVVIQEERRWRKIQNGL